MKIRYKDVQLSNWKLEMVDRANEIIKDYQDAGYNLTLRQLYYQFVSRDWLPERWADPKTGSTNNTNSYKNLGQLMNDARMSGLSDWTGIEDRTRSLSSLPHWTDPANIIQAVSEQYRIDKWQDQPKRVEVWVEKDALEDIVGRASNRMDCAYFSCRGYTSISSMWEAGQRYLKYAEQDQDIVILHLGDHDPSGIDMSRDIEDRLRVFMGDEEHRLTVERIALTFAQVTRYKPPPNPAKITDSRAKAYIREHGRSSWELDALDPKVMEKLITDNIRRHLDEKRFKALQNRQEAEREELTKTSQYWDDVKEFLTGLD